MDKLDPNQKRICFNDFKVQGNAYSKEGIVSGIKINRCTLDSGCADDTTVADWLNSNLAMITYQSTYLNLKKLDKPLESVINDQALKIELDMKNYLRLAKHLQLLRYTDNAATHSSAQQPTLCFILVLFSEDSLLSTVYQSSC